MTTSSVNDPVGVTFTIQALAPGGLPVSHVQLYRELPPGTLLYSQQPAAVQGDPVAFDEDAALSLAERVFYTEIDEQLAVDVSRYARRLHDLYAAPQPPEQQPALNWPSTAAPDSPRLEWSGTLLSGEKVDYASALAAIENLGDGWRMPTRDELASLVDVSRHNPAIDTALYPDTESSWYWTSTPCAWDDDAVWVVLFYGGSVDSTRRDLSGCIRAVRSAMAGGGNADR